jgi:hypothetical protein
MIKKCYIAIKTVTVIIGGLSLFTILSYVALSNNYNYFDIDVFFGFMTQVAIYSLIIDIPIIIITRLFSEKRNFSKNLERVLNYCFYIFILGFLFTFFGVIFLFAGDKSVIGTGGALMIWGFFINLYLLITFRIVKYWFST